MLDEPLSPELALVSPELAERARAALPERPWEAFLPKREPVREREAPQPEQPGAEQPEAELTPVPAHEPAAPPPVRVETPPLRRPTATPPAPLPAPARRRRRRLPITPLVVLGLGIVVTVAGYLPASDAPTLITPPGAGTTGPRPSTGRPAPGTYVDGQIVRLELRRDGTLTGTAVSVACDAAGPVSGTVGRDGSFRGTVTAVSDGRRVNGSILGRSAGSELQGVVRLRSSGCDSGPVLFAARRQPAPDR